MSATLKWLAANCAGWLSLLLLAGSSVSGAESTSLGSTNSSAAAGLAAAEKRLAEAKRLWDAEPKNPELAWHVARAYFDAGEFAPSDSRRAEFANGGIAAAKAALNLDARLAASHYYLALNVGQLARTKRMSALGLVDDMEEAFSTVVKLNPRFDFSGAHRCLGLLYRDAPGWPLSVGNKSKARQQLLKAVELSPEYPDNWFCLIEAELGWGDKGKARAQLKAAEPNLHAARKRFTGEEWASSWADWDKRLSAIRSRLATEKVESPKAK